MPTPSEAVAVLDRSLTRLSRDPAVLAGARYTEATLGRWAQVGVDDPDPEVAEAFRGLCDGLAGFDAADADERATRLAALRERLGALRARVGEAPAYAPVGRLLPDGVADEIIPRVPPPVPVELPAAEAPEAGREERRAERPERGEGREERRGERPERGEGREERRGERGEGRGDRRRDRRDRRDRGGEREERPAEPVAAEPPPPKVEPPPPPPPEPEVRTWPLGHPEATGQPLATLGVYTEAELALLAEAGITDVAGLLGRAPVAVDRAGERLVADVEPEGPVLARGTVRARCRRYFPHGRRFELRLEHERGVVHCRWLGEVPPEVQALKPGAEAGIVGRVERVDDDVVLYDGEVLGVDGRGGDWLPRYDVPGVPDARMRAGMRAALRAWGDSLQDHLPAEVLERHRLLPLAAAVRDAHFPANAGRKGRARMAFDELFQAQLGLALLRQRPGKERGVVNPVVHSLVAQAMGSQGWSFNDAQEAAFDEIRRDLRRNLPMARLLQGDAGTGKQLVIQAAMLMVAQSQHQVLYAAPDGLCAEHRFLFAEQLFKGVGVEPVLLNHSTPKATLEALRKGEHLVVFGTHAHLKELPTFRKLGLVVVEESAGAGVGLAAVEEGANRPDLLVVTPTAVPALVTLSAYGPLAMTTLPGSPARGVETRAFAPEERDAAYAVAREAIEAGNQVLVAFPVGRQGDLLSPSETRRLAEVLAQETFPGARVGIFNGAMTREERFRAYDDFAHRRTDVLLATTHVEHGPAVPNATVVLVEHADTVDLLRLHRLRAQVAASWKPGRCLLVSGENASAEGRAALELLAREHDGISIAEADLARRGLGSLVGPDAEDALAFGWADPAHDRDLLLKTRAEAVKLLQLDPGLKRRLHRSLLHLVRARVGEEVGGDGGPAPAAPDPGAAGRRRRRRRR